MEETVVPEKTTDLPQVTDKLYHIILYISPRSRFELTTSVVIGEFEPHSGEVYLIQYYVIKLLRTGRWFSPSTLVSSTNKTDCHDITEILLKVALNTITPVSKAHTNNVIFRQYRHCTFSLLPVLSTVFPPSCADHMVEFGVSSENYQPAVIHIQYTSI